MKYRSIRWFALLAVLCALPCALPAAEAPPPDRALGYINSLPPETPAQRAKRHARVAERKRGTPIMVHRGANRIEPENTLEAYAAAMDYGADGCEIDPRRTKDGVIYFLHDDTLNRTTNCTGKARERTYYELLQCRIKGGGKKTRIPTFYAFLALARQRAMLIHLDVKEAEIQGEIGKILEKADMWDHVVQVNGNTPELYTHPKYRMIPYMPGDHVVRDPKHVDPERIRQYLAQGPGLIFCDDPRIAAKALGRKEYDPVPIPEEVYAWWTKEGVAKGEEGKRP